MTQRKHLCRGDVGMLVLSLLVCVSIHSQDNLRESVIFFLPCGFWGRQPQVIRLDHNLREEPCCQPEAELLCRGRSLWAESTKLLKGLFS